MKRKLIIAVLILLLFAVAIASTEQYGFGYESRLMRREHKVLNDSTEQYGFAYMGLIESAGLFGYTRLQIERRKDGRIHRVSYWERDEPHENKLGVASIEFTYTHDGERTYVIQSNYDANGNLIVGTGASAFAQGRMTYDRSGVLVSTQFMDVSGAQLECSHCVVRNCRDTSVDMDLHW